jgi:hypothetical protein
MGIWRPLVFISLKGGIKQFQKPAHEEEPQLFCPFAGSMNSAMKFKRRRNLT